METVHVDARKPGGRPDKEVTIIICSADEDQKFTFDKNTKIEDVISEAVKEFKLDPKDAYDLTFPDRPKEPLEKERPLVSYPEIKDGTKLVLTSRGGGV